MNILEQSLGMYQEIKTLIQRSRQNLVSHINSTMTLTYWQIGKIIRENIHLEGQANYGKETLKSLARELTFEFGSGFSYRNILRMVNFYDQISESQKVTTLSAKLSWSHFVELLKIDNSLKREFYIALSQNENWTVRTLRERIDSLFYERSAISKLPEDTIRNDIRKLNEDKKMNSSMFIRDPYLLDFLNLKNNYSEKDLENAILEELENFILEFGNDFAFMARQKRIHIGKNDYYIDLLFYHRKLRRLVVIELKLGEFKPEYKGQVELYLNWLSKNEKQDYEEEPIALILCSGKDDEVVELMNLDNDNIHVTEYWVELPPKEILIEKLQLSIEIAKSHIKK
jgi:predicted nuclease of restriction endonuclease-like (RecB) superfamily